MIEGSAPPIGEITSVVLKRVTDDDLVLPALPWVLRGAAEALSESPFAPHKVAAALDPEPLCVARLIRKANSPAYATGASVCTSHAAVARLGPRVARIFLDDSGVYKPIVSRNADINDGRRRVWEHCVAVGLVARDLAGFAFGIGDTQATGAAYTGGLLHDLGKPVLAALLLDSERRLASAGADRWLDARDWAKVVMGSHATVGRLLAVKWGLPSVIRHCIAEPYAHDPWKVYAVSKFVTLANAVVERIGLDVSAPLDGGAMEVALAQGPKLLGFPDANIAWASRDLEARVAAHLGNWSLDLAV